MNVINIWDINMKKDIEKLNNRLIVYDNWLNKFDDFIKNVDSRIVDLGCGIGNDTLYLRNMGKEVLSCDFSKMALETLKKAIPDAVTMNFDMTDDFPIAKESTGLVIANLSLHYFDERTTFEILGKIRKILRHNGVLILRVNSINDGNYGADSLIEIEHHFYKTLNIKKRFFDENDIKHFFKYWNIVYCKEERFVTKIYEVPKSVWEIVVVKE